MYAFSKVDRLRRQHDLHVRMERDHLSPRTVASTIASVARSTPLSTLIRAPAMSISIRPRLLTTGNAVANASGAAEYCGASFDTAATVSIFTAAKLCPGCWTSARELASPYRQQPASHTVTARHIRYVCVCLKALRNDPRLLFRRPSAPALPPRNHLDPLISATFIAGIIPGIKHGSYHQAISRNQRMTANIAGNPGAREVGR